VDERVVEVLEEILVWIRASSYGRVRDGILAEFVESKCGPEVRLAYQLMDGTRSRSEILDACRRAFPEGKVSERSLSRWTTAWERRGWVGRENRTARRLFSLADFGIEVPEAAS